MRDFQSISEALAQCYIAYAARCPTLNVYLHVFNQPMQDLVDEVKLWCSNVDPDFFYCQSLQEYTILLMATALAEWSIEMNEALLFHTLCRCWTQQWVLTCGFSCDRSTTQIPFKYFVIEKETLDKQTQGQGQTLFVLKSFNFFFTVAVHKSSWLLITVLLLWQCSTKRSRFPPFGLWLSRLTLASSLLRWLSSANMLPVLCQDSALICIKVHRLWFLSLEFKRGNHEGRWRMEV